MIIDVFGQELAIPFWILMVVWSLVVLIYVVLSAILNYHWKKYGLDNKVIAQARKLYFVITPIFPVLALLALMIGYVQS